MANEPDVETTATRDTEEILAGDAACPNLYRRTSVEKLHELIATGGGMQPADPQGGQLLGILKGVAPMIVSYIPRDPDELDRLLLGLASLSLRVRSDDAEEPELEALLADPVDAEAIEEPTS